jgi:hypothetical protein
MLLAVVTGRFFRKSPWQARIMRNLHQIYDTPIYQARQMFPRRFSRKYFNVLDRNLKCRKLCKFSCNLRELKMQNESFPAVPVESVQAAACGIVSLGS